MAVARMKRASSAMGTFICSLNQWFGCNSSTGVAHVSASRVEYEYLEPFKRKDTEIKRDAEIERQRDKDEGRRS